MRHAGAALQAQPENNITRKLPPQARANRLQSVGRLGSGVNGQDMVIRINYPDYYVLIHFLNHI
jgi:hypothetical protein